MREVITGDAAEVLPSLAVTARLVYMDPPWFTGRDWGNFDDRWENLDAYLEWSVSRLAAAVAVMAPDGSLYLHVPPTVSHYLKIELDGLLGRNVFRNEIAWRRFVGRKANTRRRWSAEHDVILYYARPGAPFHPTYAKHDPREIRSQYRHVDRRGRYRLSGGRHYVTHGFSKKVYLDSNPGALVGTFWDKCQLAPSSRERTGYPTQKPLALLERIVAASSDPGDLVLDPMCGSGTALVAAKRLGRRYLGIDINADAAETARVRLAAVTEPLW